MRVPGVGDPRQVVMAALAAIAVEGIVLEAISPVVSSRPIGPSRRSYANAAAAVGCDLAPGELLGVLQRLERAFGRRHRGRRWGARPLDLDIVLWNAGPWVSPDLTIPHAQFRGRAFVLGPAAAIAGAWRDPLTGLTLRHLRARLTRPRPLRRAGHGRALSSVGRATDF